MPSRARHRSTSKKTRKNPNALYWKVGPQIPWKPWRHSPQALKALVKSNDVNLSRLARPQRASAPKPRASKPTRTTRTLVPVAAMAPSSKKIKATTKPMVVMRSLPTQRPAAKKRKATKRNPPGITSISGIGADFAGLGSALSDLGRRPMGFLWLGGGAAGTMIAGGVIGAQLGRIMPEMQPGMARLVNAATYAGTAVLLSRLPRDVTMRRQMLAGGLAIALWELAQPGATVPLVAKIPGVGRMIAPPDVQALARMPALQANPSAQAQAVAAAQPWYRAGGKGNPINWLAGAEEGDPVSVDGIAGDDGQVYDLADDNDTASMAGTGATDDDTFPSPISISGSADSVGGDHAPLMTYLGSLGCPPSGRGNGLTQLVRV